MDTGFKKLLAKISDIDLSVIEESICSYQNIHPKPNLIELHRSILNVHSQLHISSGPAVNLESLVHSGKLIHRSLFNDSDWVKISNAYKMLTELFPETDYNIFHRVCTGEQVKLKESLNGIRAWFDTVGFQVVPKNASLILEAIKKMSAQNYCKTLCIFNTFPFSVEDFKTYISPTSSPYYRAIHYYIDIGNVCAEIQLRTPSIDQWSRIHHATMYKPRITTTEKEKSLVMEYGQIANWIDFYSLATMNN